jgi:hypothetical protein
MRGWGGKDRTSKKRMLLLVREDLKNPISSGGTNCSKQSTFENRTELTESRALERIGLFGEEWAGSADQESATQIRNLAKNRLKLPTSWCREQAAAAKLAEGEGFELAVRSFGAW